MSDSNAIEIYLTSAQLRKYNKKEPFQLSHAQLLNNVKAKHLLQLNINPKAASRLTRAIKANKGHRFTSEQLGGEIHGGSVASKWFKKAGRTVKDGLNKGVHFIKQNAGAVAEGIKQVVPKEVLGEMIDSAAQGLSMYTGNPGVGLALQKAGRKGLDGVYAHDFNKPLFSRKNKAAIGNVLKNTAGNAVQQIAKNNLGSHYDAGENAYNRYLNGYNNYNRNDNYDNGYYNSLPGDGYTGYDGGGIIKRGRGRPRKGDGIGKSINKAFHKAGNTIKNAPKNFVGAVNQKALAPIEATYNKTINSVNNKILNPALNSYNDVIRATNQNIIQPVQTAYTNTLSELKGGSIVGKDPGPGGKYRGSGLAKGSVEAKAHMARIRAMRNYNKPFKGGSFI